MQTKKRLLGTLLATGLVLGTAAGIAHASGFDRCARGGHDGPSASFDRMGRGEGHNPQRMLHKLDLDEAQRDQIFEIMHEQRPAMRDQRKGLDTARSALHEAVAAGADEARIRELAAAQAERMTEMLVLRAETAREMRAVLTPEQRQQMEQRMQKQERRFGH